MKNLLKKVIVVLTVAFMLCALTVPAFAAEADRADHTVVYVSEEAAEAVSSGLSDTSSKAFAAAIVVGIAAAAGAVAMGLAIGKSAEGIARQPEASGEIRSGMMLGLVFIETAIIYALIVAILIVFVL